MGRRLGVIYLVVQGAGALVWWLALLWHPPLRKYFLPARTPDALLLAFGLPDALLFIAAAWLAAWGWQQQRAWTLPVLCLHVGAACYAALYCLALWLMTGQALVGALLMFPSLVIPAYLAWQLFHEKRRGDA
jgi:hypothetical protein